VCARVYVCVRACVVSVCGMCVSISDVETSELSLPSLVTGCVVCVCACVRACVCCLYVVCVCVTSRR